MSAAKPGFLRAVIQVEAKTVGYLAAHDMFATLGPVRVGRLIVQPRRMRSMRVVVDRIGMVLLKNKGR